MSSNLSGKRKKNKESKKPPRNWETQRSRQLFWLRCNSYEARSLAGASWFQWRIPLLSAKDKAWPQAQRTWWTLSRTCCWHTACSFWPSPRLSSGCLSCPSFFKKKKFSFFFSSVDKYHFDSPKDWGLFICHRSTAEVEVFLTLPCRKAAAPTLFQHGYLRLERAGVRTPVCCTCHGPQPACLGFLHRTRPPTRW